MRGFQADAMYLFFGDQILLQYYTSNKKLLVTKGIATRSKDATRSAPGLPPVLGTKAMYIFFGDQI